MEKRKFYSHYSALFRTKAEGKRMNSFSPNRAIGNTTTVLDGFGIK